MQRKVAFVTGAASGIGRATALAFAREGARVALVDRDAHGGEETLGMVRGDAGDGLFVHADISRSADVARAVDRTIASFGGLDFAFNNAGIEGDNATTVDYDEDEWDRVIANNLKGTWLCMKHEIARMRGKGGAIVNTASVAGLVGFAEEPAYVASKHAIVGLTRTAALELAAESIRVNAVCPGAVDTPMLARSTQHSDLEDYIAHTPQRRVARAGEIADAVLWLCSEAAAFVTGIALPIDGGWVTQ
jgi:NAD(P)-dependent dehydrogenase (short-subunit alcohol dehydrogenase family)